MRSLQNSYKSLAEYDLERLFEQKKALVSVESALRKYQINNSNLVDQVYSLIQQNQILRKNAAKNSIQQSRHGQFKPQCSMMKANRTFQINTVVQTAKKYNLQTSILKPQNPRNVYLAPQQICRLNKKHLKQAKKAHKQYDHSREYEQFKETLNGRKEMVRQSYSKKSNFRPSELTISRKAYIEEPQRVINERQPLKQIHRTNQKQEKRNAPQNKFKIPTSPYDTLKQLIVYHSPIKNTPRGYQPSAKQTQRSSSAGNYCKNSIKISEPKTKWEDLPQPYFQTTNSANPASLNDILSHKKMQNISQSQNLKSKRKKFLSIISQPAGFADSKFSK